MKYKLLYVQCTKRYLLSQDILRTYMYSMCMVSKAVLISCLLINCSGCAVSDKRNFPSMFVTV